MFYVIAILFVGIIMINAKTWHRLCLSMYLFIPAILIGWFVPEDSPLQVVQTMIITWCVSLAVVGGIAGVALVCFDIQIIGCPLCKRKCYNVEMGTNGMVVDCPECGQLRLKSQVIVGLKIIRSGTAEDDLASYEPANCSPLRAPLQYPVPFAVIYFPVVLSVIVASIIHQFTFFYLLIPGFWCYCVGGFLLDAYFRGSISDNTGTAVRSSSPFSFYRKIAFWALFYILAAVFPIGFAIQESVTVTIAQLV